MRWAICAARLAGLEQGSAFESGSSIDEQAARAGRQAEGQAEKAEGGQKEAAS